MEPLTPSRRGTFDLPKPETGLAEWTNKIKALQRQVDADEEAEQKRLEEEIAAARRARLRRSRGAGHGGDGGDPLVSPSAVGIPLSGLSKSPSSEVPKSPSERRGDYDDALRKLSGVPSSSNVDTSSITQGILPRPSQFPAKQPPSQRAEPVSLAAFIGGRATGPRLNRHAPQADVSDATQFEQRNVTGPHPIFGKGGVAMPGMVTRTGTSVREAVKASEAVERYQPRLAKRTSTPSFTKQAEETPSPRPISPQKSGHRERTISTPGTPVSPYSHYAQHQPISPQKSGNRERTLSTPGPTSSHVSKSPFSRSNVEIRSPNTERRPISPGKDRASPPSRPTTPSRPISERPITPRQSSVNPNNLVSPSKPTISTPSLARAILPEPRFSSQGPVITSHTVASPAFQKPLAQKDPTPSISRLQGRGFVQNMVRASAQLETSGKSAPSSPSSRPSSGRKSSVLDRWQPNVAPPSPTPAPAPRRSSPVRKSCSEMTPRSDPPPLKVAAPAPSTPSPVPGKALKSKSSHPHLHPDPLAPPEPLSPRRAKIAERMLPPEGAPGFGSATTMVVYKPKTPEPEKSTPPEVAGSPGVDELGVRHDSNSDGKARPRFSVPAELPGPAGKPLNHPTKERARKPKKNRDTNDVKPPQGNLTFGSVTDLQPSREKSLPLPRSPQISRSSSPKSNLEQPPLSPSLSKPQTRLAVVETSSEKAPASRVSQITQKWGSSAPIGLKPITSSVQTSQGFQNQAFQPEIKPKSDPTFVRRALPGMGKSDSLRAPPTSTPVSKSLSPESTLQVTSEARSTRSSDVSPSSTSGHTGSTSSSEGLSKSPSSSKSDRPPRSPSSPKHTRIPSTGNRALVMDVAQALQDYNASAALEPTLRQEETKSPVSEPVPEPLPGRRPSPSLEKRRSSYDRFSVVSVMPPLKEEATPRGTPFGTLTRTLNDTLSNTTSEQPQVKLEEKAKRDSIHFEFHDSPIPSVNVEKLLQSRSVSSPLSSPDAKTISVDVLSIVGNSTIAVSRDVDTFYDSELLVIIHRYKSKSSGLVSTQVWVWRGRKSILGEKEERKIQELAKRYNTTPTMVHQNTEPPALVYLLGCVLVIRQGSRSHWSAENTAMYSVRNFDGVTFIDEHDLSVKNLCSAFSYCLTILDTVYIWHGCGSTDGERQAAVKYVSRLSEGGTNAIHLYEGENDQDELFWMALGEEEFARANYWQWRRGASDVDPRIWRVDASADAHVVAISSLRSEASREKSVYIIDCIWELFVKVGSEARGDRASIKLALDIAKRFSDISATSRPFTPTVHVLVLPSKLPLDLRLNLRELDDAEVNNGEVPDHMNLLSLTQAENHLRQQSWERLALQDQTMLPLGLSASGAQ